MKVLFKSKRFIAALINMLVIVLLLFFPSIPEESLTQIIMAVSAPFLTFILGDSLRETGKKNPAEEE